MQNSQPSASPSLASPEVTARKAEDMESRMDSQCDQNASRTAPPNEAIRPQCAACGGSGQMVVGEYRVTRDMAIDAGDRSMEGAFYDYAYGECDACEGTGYVG